MTADEFPPFSEPNQVPSGDDLPTSDGSSANVEWGADDERSEGRYVTTLPLTAIPIAPDDSPVTQAIVYGYTHDLSVRGIRFRIADEVQSTPKRWLLGIEDRQGDMHYATVVTRHVSRSAAAGWLIGTEFVVDARDPFTPANLEPRWDPVSLRIQTGLREPVRQAWVELGVLQPYFLDYVLVCPECDGLPTWRRGCCHCSGAAVRCCQLIHHYACAHVGPAQTFEQPDGLTCPKCRCNHLVIGVDFEYQQGEFVCEACGWKDSRLEDVAQCLRCQLRFPGRQAVEKELLGYDFRRLDPVAVLDAV